MTTPTGPQGPVDAKPKLATVPATGPAPYRPIVRSPHSTVPAKRLILVQGGPGEGKSHFACTWPKPFAVIFDPGTATHDRLEVNWAAVETWDQVERYWLKALEQRRVSELVQSIEAEDGSHPYAGYRVETLVLDSLSFLAKTNSLEISEGGAIEMKQRGWDIYQARISRLLNAARRTARPDPRRPDAETYHIVATVHEQTRTFGEDGQIEKIVNGVQGQVNAFLPAYFDGHYLTERKAEPGGKMSYWLHTRPIRSQHAGRGKEIITTTRDCKGDTIVGPEKMPAVLPNNYQAFAKVWGWEK